MFRYNIDGCFIFTYPLINDEWIMIHYECFHYEIHSSSLMGPSIYQSVRYRYFRYANTSLLQLHSRSAPLVSLVGYYNSQKFQDSSHLLWLNRPVCVKTWSKPQIVGFVMRKLKYHKYCCRQSMMMNDSVEQLEWREPLIKTYQKD